MHLFTIGYEGRPIADFIALLHTHGVKRIVDVRRHVFTPNINYSRKFLQAHLEAAGIEYVWIADFAPSRKLLRQVKHESLPFADYANRFRHELEQNAYQINRRRDEIRPYDCLLCKEADPHMCHRTIVAQLLSANYTAI